jgi:hypothetical protein
MFFAHFSIEVEEIDTTLLVASFTATTHCRFHQDTGVVAADETYALMASQSRFALGSGNSDKIRLYSVLYCITDDFWASEEKGKAA